MRPEKAKRVINSTIQRYLDGEPTAMYIPDMTRALNTMSAKQIIWHKEHGYNYEVMYTNEPSDEMYNSCEGEMEYISDRWNSPQRLAWLIKGIEESKF